MKMPWRVILGASIVSWILIELLDDRVGLRDARFITWAVVIPVGLWIAWRLQKDELERWAKGRGVEVVPSIAPELKRYLSRNRRFSIVAGLLSLGVVWGYDRLTAPGSMDWAVGLFLVVPVSGLVLGAQMLAERTFTPEAEGAVRKAELVARRLTDYVPHRIVMVLRSLGAATVLLALGSMLFDVSQDDSTLLLIIGLVAGVFVIIVEFSQRWRTQWPRPFESTEAAHLQDVLRADAIRVAIWGGVIAGSTALAAQLIVLGRQFDDVAGWALPLLGALLMIISAVGAYRSSARGFSLARRGMPASSG